MRIIKLLRVHQSLKPTLKPHLHIQKTKLPNFFLKKFIKKE